MWCTINIKRVTVPRFKAGNLWSKRAQSAEGFCRWKTVQDKKLHCLFNSILRRAVRFFRTLYSIGYICLVHATHCDTCASVNSLRCTRRTFHQLCSDENYLLFILFKHFNFECPPPPRLRTAVLWSISITILFYKINLFQCLTISFHSKRQEKIKTYRQTFCCSTFTSILFNFGFCFINANSLQVSIHFNLPFVQYA